MAQKEIQSKYWCIGAWFYPENYMDIINSMNKCTYKVWGHEKCPTTGRPHIHMYAEFEKRQRWSQVVKHFGGCHVSVRSGTPVQAALYCQETECGKTDWFKEEGEISNPEQGKRNDIMTVQKKIMEGTSMSEIMDNHPTTFLRYHKGLQLMKFDIDRRTPKRVPKVIVYWGETGTGKTFKVSQKSPNCFYTSDCKWYDGYNGLDDICFEEYNGGITLNNFLRLLDRYPVTVQGKGTVIPFNPERIFITSHFHPNRWYTDEEHVGRYPELERRIHVCKEFRKCRENVHVTEVAGNTSQQLRAQKPQFKKIKLF